MSFENNKKVVDLKAFRDRRQHEQWVQDNNIERNNSPETIERLSMQLAVYAEQAGKIAHLLKQVAEQGETLSEASQYEIQKCYDLLSLEEFQLLLNQYLPASLSPAWMVTFNDVGADRVKEIMSSYKPLYQPLKNASEAN
jgi:hypothetical protein